MYGYNKKGIAVEEGMNARIAEIQAAILRIKLRIFKDWLDRRLHVAQIYNKGIDLGIILKHYQPHYTMQIIALSGFILFIIALIFSFQKKNYIYIYILNHMCNLYQ